MNDVHSHLVRLTTPVFLVAVSLAVPVDLGAQVPSPQQVQQLQQDPERVRQMIRQSGLSPEQLRSRLAALGYSPALLDQILEPAVAGAPALEIDQQMLAALAALGVDPLLVQGLEPIPVIVGPQLVDTARIGRDSLLEQAGELRLFGLDVFRRTTTQFQPILAGPVPSNYRLGPGDRIVLVLTGDVELIHELQVTREGFIVIPQVGQLSVANLTMEQLRRLVGQRLRRSYSGIAAGTTLFEMTITQLRTNQIFVTGEVAQPGAYQLSSVATVLNALYAAGGLTERGNFREIAVRRRGDVVAAFDLYQYLLRGDTRADVMLDQGDVIFVPVRGTRAAVSGAVVRPAIYELRAGETLTDLIEAAGGFRADAELRRISIARIVPPSQRGPEGPDRVFVDVPTDQVRDGRAPPVVIEPGDSVTVFEVAEASRSYVELVGAVYHPGRFAWRPGMRLSELVRLAGGFRPAVYPGRAHIERLNLADSARYMVVVELPADSTQPYPNDIALHDYDIVTVYGREEFRENRIVSISGMVNRPGTYPYRAGMTLRDLVLKARGLRDGALLDTAEVARLPADRSGGTLAIRLRIPMDSTYVFEGNPSIYRQLPGLPAPGKGAPEVTLEPYDQVTIFRQPEFELQRTVNVTGEVRFPGTYAITSKDELISDLVERADGVLPTAYVEGARFFRQTGNAGQVNIELARAIARPGGPHDINLRPGDSLDIPEYDPTVRVTGAVNSPTSVLYRDGGDLDYYIANAGGYRRNADKGRVSVRYANGSARVKSGFLFFRSVPKPGPGSTVFVPESPPSEGLDVTQLLATVAQILVSAVAIVAIATR